MVPVATGLFLCRPIFSLFFFFNDTATTEIYTLSLHDALPIPPTSWSALAPHIEQRHPCPRSEEHTSELQSLRHLVCRLLLEKKKKKTSHSQHILLHCSEYCNPAMHRSC